MTPMQQTPKRTPTHMPTSNRPRNMGASLADDASRVDAVAKVTGEAKYGRDIYSGDQLFVGFIRCPYGAGELNAIDRDAAMRVPGVIEIVMTSENGRGQYHGHSVGYIVAESKTALRRGMRAADPIWQRSRDFKTGIEDTVRERASVESSVRRRLNGADFVVETSYSTPVQTHSSLETHGAVAHHQGDRAVVYASTQGTFATLDGAAEPLGLAKSRVEVRCEYIGGGFGSKLQPGKEVMIACEVSRKHKRPVSLFVDRDEEHLDTGNRPSSLIFASVGINRDGSIVGGQINTFGGVGVGRGGGGVSFPSGRYDLANVEKHHQDVQFNAGSPRPFRAPGRPQGAFAEELLLDELATGIDMDPLELRRKLEVSDDRREMYELGAELIGWSRRKKTGSQTGTTRTGLGLGTTDWPRFPAQADAEVVIHRDGSVEARTGTQDIGTGQRTVMAVCAAVALGIPLHMVDVRIGNSTLPNGPGSGGSVTSTNSSVAMMAAAADARQKLLEAVAGRVGGDASEFEIHEGHVVRDHEPVMTFAEACARINGESVTGRGSNDDTSRQRFGGEGHSQGVQFVEVEVDTEIGVISVKRVIAIQACGQVACRKTAESQIIGGVVQGLSYALFENRILDPSLGAMINPNLEQYKILGTADMPHIQPVLWTKGQTGIRPLGEPPTIPTAGATACALFNAIGRPVRHLPLTPDRVLAALEGAAL